ncbi:MAG: DUF1893 domain-containing protein [Clostridiales bacterium]|nr:DUF1893 domain-containing protein [Clostridiales bacterium]
MTDLLRAKEQLKQGDYTCVLCKGDTFHHSYERGVAPMVALIRQGVDVAGFSAADKVVGKAAALLFVLAKVKEVYADVMSEGAVEMLKKYGIPHSYGALTHHIINRTGTDYCPMEKTVWEIDDPQAAYDAVCKTMAALKSGAMKA